MRWPRYRRDMVNIQVIIFGPLLRPWFIRPSSTVPRLGRLQTCGDAALVRLATVEMIRVAVHLVEPFPAQAFTGPLRRSRSTKIVVTHGHNERTSKASRATWRRRRLKRVSGASTGQKIAPWSCSKQLASEWVPGGLNESAPLVVLPDKFPWNWHILPKIHDLPSNLMLTQIF